jgi:hypothetical protein
MNESLHRLKEELIKQDQANFRVKQQMIKRGEALDLPTETWRNLSGGEGHGIG